LKKFWKIFLVIFIVVMIFFPFIAPALAAWASGAGLTTLATLITSLGSLPWFVTAAAGIGLAWLADSGTTKEIIQGASDAASAVADGVGQAAGSVVDNVGDVVNHATSALLSNPLVLGLGALAIYWFFFKDDTKDTYVGRISDQKKDEPKKVSRDDVTDVTAREDDRGSLYYRESAA
jgi:hypothetical protein